LSARRATRVRNASRTTAKSRAISVNKGRAS
jgi:hypothetical protein